MQMVTTARCSRAGNSTNLGKRLTCKSSCVSWNRFQFVCALLISIVCVKPLSALTTTPAPADSSVAPICLPGNTPLLTDTPLTDGNAANATGLCLFLFDYLFPSAGTLYSFEIDIGAIQMLGGNPLPLEFLVLRSQEQIFAPPDLSGQYTVVGSYTFTPTRVGNFYYQFTNNNAISFLADDFLAICHPQGINGSISYANTGNLFNYVTGFGQIAPFNYIGYLPTFTAGSVITLPEVFLSNSSRVYSLVATYLNSQTSNYEFVGVGQCTDNSTFIGCYNVVSVNAAFGGVLYSSETAFTSSAGCISAVEQAVQNSGSPVPNFQVAYFEGGGNENCIGAPMFTLIGSPVACNTGTVFELYEITSQTFVPTISNTGTTQPFVTTTTTTTTTTTLPAFRTCTGLHAPAGYMSHATAASDAACWNLCLQTSTCVVAEFIPSWTKCKLKNSLALSVPVVSATSPSEDLLIPVIYSCPQVSSAIVPAATTTTPFSTGTTMPPMSHSPLIPGCIAANAPTSTFVVHNIRQHAIDAGQNRQNERLHEIRQAVQYTNAKYHDVNVMHDSL